MARKPNNKGVAAPATQLTTTANAAPQQEAAKSEKAKRPPAVVQNGVTRPRAGGLCAAVWEITEKLANGGDLPTIAAVKAEAAVAGLNPTNVSIEYYRCRQFHGVRGRQPKPQPQAETAQ